MKKGILVAFLAIGFIFAGVLSASAAVWTLVETSGMIQHSPGADGIIGTSDDGTSDQCNMDPVVNCASVGSPTKGAYSYAELDFVYASSCGAGLTGQSCTQNTDCGNPLTPCVPCNPPAQIGLTYFGQNAAGGAKGAGTYTAKNCENSGDITALAIGTSEVVSHVGGSCMGLNAFNSGSGCADGTASQNYDVRLWTSTIPGCNYNAGVMPGLNLAGRIYAVPTVSTGVCTYSTGEINAIISAAGLGAGDYLSILCGSGTLPTDLSSVCIPGADWEAVIVASTTTDIGTTCPAACPTGCTGAAAEGVE